MSEVKMALRKRWMQFNASTTQIEHRDERVRRVEAEGSTSDHPQAIVGPLDDPVGQALLNVGEHAFLLGPDRPRNLDEWRELGSARPREPVIEGPSRTLWLQVVKRAGTCLS